MFHLKILFFLQIHETFRYKGDMRKQFEVLIFFFILLNKYIYE